MFGLEQFDVNERIYIDTETTSFDDDVEALRPYHGHKLTTIIIGQVGKKTLAYPIRNRNGTAGLLPLEKFLEAFRAFAATVKRYANLNVKFDLRFMAQDGIFFSHPDVIFEDTGTLARLVNNQETSFALEHLCKKYNCALKKSDIIVPFLAGRKDYGVIPVDILCEYGIGDVDSNIELHEKLLELLPDECEDVWRVEQRFTKILFELEHRGIPIDVEFLNKRRVKLLIEMVLLLEKIKKVTNGRIDNPASSAQVAAYFTSEGIDPVVFNDPTDKMKSEGRTQGNASWNADALEQINHPVATLIIEYKEKQIQESTFCAGWVREADDNNRIHPDFKSNGAKTGRPSSSQPNVYNPPKWIMEAITIPAGYVGVKWDKSQIEYRLFAHYAKDADLLQKYKDKPDIDYHQILADRLGLPRDPTKNVNFGILYGMGKKKMIRKLAALIGELLRTEIWSVFKKEKNGKALSDAAKINLRKTLLRYVQQSGKDPMGKIVIGDTGPIDPVAFVFAAEAILVEYHQKVPAVKKMQDKVKQAIQHRGYIFNFFKRRYYYPIEFAYIALNALIQGSAADFFKLKLCQLFERCSKQVHMVDMIYDSCFAIMPLEVAQEYWDLARQIVCDSPFDVPVLIDGEVALYHWGNIHKIVNNDVLLTAGLICHTKRK